MDTNQQGSPTLLAGISLVSIIHLSDVLNWSLWGHMHHLNENKEDEKKYRDSNEGQKKYSKHES